MKNLATRGVAAQPPRQAGEPEGDNWLTETLRHVRETQFGQVTLTIHQGEVIEVQKTEKRRFTGSRKGT